MVKTKGTNSGSSSSRKKVDEEDTISIWDSDVENENETNNENDEPMESDEDFIPPSELQPKTKSEPVPRRRKIITRAKKLGIGKGGDVAKTPINYKLNFKQLGGLEEQIRVINESIIFRHQNAEALKRSGLKHTIGGILLEGPPGTGKTICAHTIAAELSRKTDKYYSFYTHNAVECFSKWMGDTEKSIRKLFESAAQNKPAIIFFDEFDSLCPRRDVGDKSGGHSHSYTTIVGTLLAEFNNIQDNDIIIIATTNLKSSIDPAMLRNGRFDFSIHFPLPNQEQRKSILQIKMQNYKVADEVFDFLSKQTEGFSGSSLAFLCDEAKLNAFKRQKQLRGTNAVISGRKNTSKRKAFTLTNVDKEDFLQVFKTVQIPKPTEHNQDEQQEQQIQSDLLFQSVCDQLLTKLTPYVFNSNDQDHGDHPDHVRTRSGLICNCYSNCFLIWSSNSNVILNDMILPRVLKLLHQPIFKISQDVIDNIRQEKFLMSPLKAFHSIVTEAKKCGKPSILLVENLDEILLGDGDSDINGNSNRGHDKDQTNLTPENIFRELSYLGNHLVFVLATSSKGTSELPKEVQKLFKPFHKDKAYELPLPSSKEILESFQYVYAQFVEPTLDKLTLRQSQTWKGRTRCQQQLNQLTAKSFMNEIQRFTNSSNNNFSLTFHKASALRSEICTLCRVSEDPLELRQNIWTLLQHQ